MNGTENVILRDYEAQQAKGHSSFDLKLGPDGLVHPKTGNTFQGSKTARLDYCLSAQASVRPESPFLEEIVHKFNSPRTTIYRLPKGESLCRSCRRFYPDEVLLHVETELPPSLVCLHEYTDHHSLQCTKPISLNALNAELTALCRSVGERMTKEDYLDRYGSLT